MGGKPGGKPDGKFGGKFGGKPEGKSFGKGGPRRDGEGRDGGRDGGPDGGKPWEKRGPAGEGGRPPRRDGDRPEGRRDGKPGGKPGQGRPGRDGEGRGKFGGKPGEGRGGYRDDRGPRGEGRGGPRDDRSPRGEGRGGPRGENRGGHRGENRGGPRGENRGGNRDRVEGRKPRHGAGERPTPQAPRLPKEPRRAALRLLEGVLTEGKLLSEMHPGLAPMAPEDRARTQRLTSDTLRFLPRLDQLLSQHMERLPDLEVLNILRLAALELVQGAAAHGVVNEAVEACSKLPRHGHLKGLVNAVLRRVSEGGEAAWAALPVPEMPEWLREPLIEGWGEEAIEGMEAAHAAGAPLDITPRDPAQAAALAEQLGGTLLPTGSIRLTEPGKISALPGFDEGAWWVQDAAAALPARLLAAQPGERVLDLCAAPGGKTMQLAAAGADVTAVDVSEKRLETVSENLGRTGLTASIIASDALAFTGEAFDAILLDAPCSATGTIRRHPDLPYAKDGSDFAGLFELQEKMIDHALSLLKPGGRLVYCTCSLLPDEGEVQIEEAQVRNPQLTVDPVPEDLPGLEPEWLAEEGGLRLRPDFWAERGGMDGFYMAVLRKPA
ncbi:methyltransferase domain-containing protein [Maritimibacter alkaliphilus]|nr:methyltransferase domain-containing protein [Maritimibacter alkaliphilus]